MSEQVNLFTVSLIHFFAEVRVGEKPRRP
jgi:hypothetical protein